MRAGTKLDKPDWFSICRETGHSCKERRAKVNSRLEDHFIEKRVDKVKSVEHNNGRS